MRKLALSLLLWTLAIPLSLQAQLPDPIAYYPLDGNPDDAAGFNDAFEQGDATPVDVGLVNGAYSFGTGTDTSPSGSLVVPLDVSADSFPDLTITMWVKADPSIAGSSGLYKTFGHDDGGWDRGFGLDNRQGEYRWAAFNGNGITQTTGTPVTDEWTFLAAVWDTDGDADPLTSSATVTFYANAGSVTEPLTNTLGQIEASIGAVRPDLSAETFIGLIDEVRIFDEALTEAQIDLLRFPDQLAVAGDANDDGVVDLDDYELIQANAFQPDPLGEPRLGDVNLDRMVDFEDFRIWKTAFETAGPPSSVPEPAAFSLVLMGVLAMLHLVRRR